MSKAAWFLALTLIASAAVAGDERIAFPSTYKSTFTNYLNLDRIQNEDQIIHLFANDIASDAAQAVRELPNGSGLVGEI